MAVDLNQPSPVGAVPVIPPGTVPPGNTKPPVPPTPSGTPGIGALPDWAKLIGSLLVLGLVAKALEATAGPRAAYGFAFVVVLAYAMVPDRINKTLDFLHTAGVA